MSVEELSAYIESGVLELYVLGALPPQEMREVERMAEANPAVRKELDEIGEAMQKYSEAHAISPAPALREQVLAAIARPTVDYPEPTAQAPTGVVTLKPSYGAFRYAFAACLALLLISWVALFSVYQNLQASQQAYAALQGANRQIAVNASYLQQQLDEKDKVLSVLSDPDFTFVDLKGTPNAPSAGMKVAFNPKKQEVMIDMASMEMPANDKDHQYQLWALVDGKPVDLGVFDMSADSTGMKKMRSIARLQTFAVTLEPRGGSANPTLTQLMVAGNI